MQKFKGFFQIASIHYYDTMNSMQYSKKCENINFFLILSLDIGFDLLFWFTYMYFNLKWRPKLANISKNWPLSYDKCEQCGNRFQPSALLLTLTSQLDCCPVISSYRRMLVLTPGKVKEHKSTQLKSTILKSKNKETKKHARYLSDF